MLKYLIISMSFLSVLSACISNDPIISQSELLYNGNYHTVLGATYETQVDPFTLGFYTPSSAWYNGKQYIAWRRNHNSSDGKPVIAVWDQSTLTVRVVTEFELIPSVGYHDNVNVEVDSDGYIYILQIDHNARPFIYKSDNPEDVSAFTSLTRGTGSNCSYPHFGSTPQGFCLFGRTATFTGTNFQVSSDGTNWTRYELTTTNADGFPDYRHYPYVPHNWITDNWLYVMIQKRTYDNVTFRYPYTWILKTPIDANFGKVWYNEQENHSHDISTSGAIPEDDLKTYYQVYGATDFKQYTIPSAIVKNGKVYVNPLYGTDVVPDEYRIYSYNGSWGYDIMTRPYLLNAGGQMYGLGALDITEIPSAKFALTKLNDDGSIISTQSDFFVPTDGILFQNAGYHWMYSYPHNLDEIPRGSTFLFGAPTDKDNGYGRESATQNDITFWEIEKT